VRDFLLRRRPKDIDIATSAMPEEVLRLFPNSRAIGAQFGVVQVPMYGHPYEVATFRSDNDYLDGRHPSSVTFSGPEQDALRRDFTINGLFYDPVAGRLIDYVHGKNDLQRKLIRTIGNSGDRLSEDRLRMLRAIRLACTLDFTIAPETWSAIRKLASGILQVSWERIRDELVKIFTGPAPAGGLDLLRDSGLLAQILPEVQSLCGVPFADSIPDLDVFAHTRNGMALLRKPSAVLAFAALLHDSGKPVNCGRGSLESHAETSGKIAEEVCRRLRMPNQEIHRIVELVTNHIELFNVTGMRESTVKRFLRRGDFADHLELHRVNCISGKRNLTTYNYWLSKREEYAENPVGEPFLTGEDLIAMGYSPGPIFKEILEKLEDLQLEGTIRTREEALAQVRAAFPKPDADPDSEA